MALSVRKRQQGYGQVFPPLPASLQDKNEYSNEWWMTLRAVGTDMEVRRGEGGTVTWSSLPRNQDSHRAASYEVAGAASEWLASLAYESSLLGRPQA